MGANVQICWDKFANYWDVEPRLIPMEGDRLHLGAAEAVAACDENHRRRGGARVDVRRQLRARRRHLRRPRRPPATHGPRRPGARRRGVRRHDRAVLRPDLVWDFRLPRVASINTSGHKYGLVNPGVGWAAWRDRAALPEDLVFNVNYLGGQMPTFALNFSRPGGQVIAQYYNFLRLGRDGYRRVQLSCRAVAERLSATIADLGPFRLLTDGTQLPVFAFVIDGEQPFSVFDVSAGLREQGWLVPAYTFPKNREDIAALRIVVPNGFTHHLADLLLDDLRRVLARLEQQTAPARGPEGASFAHGTR
jgi:glutamate decarboxylase